ncbi:MAG: sugar ABC transporter permease [Chloroflexota bacterium]
MKEERFFPKDPLAIVALFLATLFFVTIFWWPILNTFWLSLQRKYFAETGWIGLANFRELFTDDRIFFIAFSNSFKFTLMVVPAVIVIGLGLAVAVNALTNRSLRGFLTSSFFVAYVVPLVAVAVVWRFIFLPNQQGLFNTFLTSIGLSPLRWLLDSQTALLSLAIVSIWRTSGYALLIYLAGLQAIPETLYEAARIDGASGWSLFRHISWPLLIPTTAFVAIISTLRAFMMFTETFVMTGERSMASMEQGGPNYSTTTVVFYIYQTAFIFFREGYASALAVCLFIVMVLLSYVQFRVIRTRYEY